ncbi:hypothetical protein NP233_g3927 [Leucocoprinus birnbaumii]|uniref:Uncharacterized protein n=1 Tax=Leucocoprinus birnbaumii TaxID=56174 RepID=A0AAD5YSD2_9AGAR|nr:hypothetical protein NP233_g3927 [Leucocoprinus birnbaumii]
MPKVVYPYTQLSAASSDNNSGCILNNGVYIQKHPIISGLPHNANGKCLGLNPPPPPPLPPPQKPASYPFNNASEFELGDFLFKQAQMSGGDITKLMDHWCSYNANWFSHNTSPFKNADHLHGLIDTIPHGDIPWQGATVSYSGPQPANPAPWMEKTYEIWYCDPLAVLEAQIANPAFANHINWSPKCVCDARGIQQFKDLMSGQWAWEQADKLAKSPMNHGTTFAPIVLSSNKTTVSVATGQNNFYPVYASLGNISNEMQCAHEDGMTLIAFLAIPKTNKTHEQVLMSSDDMLFHDSLSVILCSLKPFMETPKLTPCGHGYYHRILYGIGPYIADYPEQCLLTGVTNGWCTAETQGSQQWP